MGAWTRGAVMEESEVGGDEGTHLEGVGRVWG